MAAQRGGGDLGGQHLQQQLRCVLAALLQDGVHVAKALRAAAPTPLDETVAAFVAFSRAASGAFTSLPLHNATTKRTLRSLAKAHATA